MTDLREIQASAAGQCLTKDGTEIIIKKAGLKDLDDVYGLEKKNSLRPYPYNVMQDTFNSATVFVADCGGRCVGYAALSIVFEDAEIINLVVDKELRKRGVGGALLGVMIEESRKNSAKRILLEVEDTNFAAIGLYRSFGFVKISTRERYYGDNCAIIMELVI